MACVVCDPELEATPRSSGEHHVTIRQPMGWSFCVYKDGKSIADCYEVNALEGWAKRYYLPPRLCACGGHAEAYIDRGNFAFVPSRTGDCEAKQPW